MDDAEKIKIYEEALDEIAYGAPWGGPAQDHVRFLLKTADEALIKTGANEE